MHNRVIKQEEILAGILQQLPSMCDAHVPGSPLYEKFKVAARKAVEALFGDERPTPRHLPPIGTILFPYFKMGAVDSLNLFDLDELIIFTFYWANRGRYRHVLDMGANIGLHSVVLSKCGYQVRCYEPDPTHYAALTRNLKLNECQGVQAFNAAVSKTSGTMDFIRVLGNTSSSHLAGSKPNPYGALEHFPVQVVSFAEIAQGADLVKLDVEGHEGIILRTTTRKQWGQTDALVEVGSAENAAAIFEHFQSIQVGLFAQKKAWGRILHLSDMPTSYHEGSLFITTKKDMPW
jgi:FkbM family methyltransferase